MIFFCLPPSMFPFSLFSLPHPRCVFCFSFNVGRIFFTILDLLILFFSWAIHSNCLFAVGHTFQPFFLPWAIHFNLFSLFQKLNDVVSACARVRATLTCPKRPSLRAQAPVIAGLRARPRNCGRPIFFSPLSGLISRSREPLDCGRLASGEAPRD